MDFFIDFGLFALLIVVITALMGSIGAVFGESLFGKKKNEIYNQDARKRTGWKKVERKAE